MSRSRFPFVLFILSLIVSFPALSAISNKSTDPSAPQVTIGGSFLYLEPAATDGDFQYGTVVGPVFAARQVTNAQLQAVHPDFRSAFELNFDYQFANHPEDIAITYLRYNQTFNQSSMASFNPFVQNFLGGAFINGNAVLTAKINQADIGVGKAWLLVHRLLLHPHVGFRYLSVNRGLDVQYGNFILNPLLPSNLTGAEMSEFQGGGLFADVNFDYLITHSFHLTGYFGAGLLLGSLNSQLNANFMLGGANIPYNASYHDSTRFVPVIDERLGFNYHFILYNDTVLLFEVGYRGDDFINAIQRISPQGGFARNPAGSNPPAISNTASIGVHGPYAKLNLIFHSNESAFNSADPIRNLASDPAGFFLRVTNSAAKPFAQKADLTYGLLSMANGSVVPTYATPGYDWYGQFELGYLFQGTNADIALSYSRFGSSDSDSVTVGPGQSLVSLNASGIATVTFNQASSIVNYCLNEVDLKGGQNFAINDQLNLHFSTGIAYASIERTQNNQYLGGSSGGANKFPVLNSTFRGLGPLFGIDIATLFNHYFGFAVHFNASLLFGQIKSTLNETNSYSFGVTTFNTLTTNHMQFIVPNLGGKIGFTYQRAFGKHYQANVEIGYQGQFYYKAINLVYPVFLTGLEQTNTSLIIAGPYLTISVMGVKT